MRSAVAEVARLRRGGKVGSKIWRVQLSKTNATHHHTGPLIPPVVGLVGADGCDNGSNVSRHGGGDGAFAFHK